MTTILRDRFILISFCGSLLVNIILWVMLIDKFALTREPIPLHFSIVYGIDFVGSSRQIYRLPSAGLFVVLTNFWLGKILYPEHPLFAYFLTAAALVMQLFLLTGAVALMILNG